MTRRSDPVIEIHRPALTRFDRAPPFTHKDRSSFGVIRHKNRQGGDHPTFSIRQRDSDLSDAFLGEVTIKPGNQIQGIARRVRFEFQGMMTLGVFDDLLVG